MFKAHLSFFKLNYYAVNMEKEISLGKRFQYIVDELKRFPSEEELLAVPYWSQLREQALEAYGSLAQLEEECRMDEVYVDFPSQEQEETATQILENKRILVRDSAGSGKTAPALKARYALEQIEYAENGKPGKVLGIIICPGYVISSWKEKINEYTDGKASIECITSKVRNERIEGLHGSLKEGSVPDFLLVSYDSVFRGVRYESDSLADIDTPEANENGVEEEALANKLVEYAQDTKLPLYLTLDEPQHIKNPKALRSKAVRKLALEADHLVALSGTIFPDYLDDIYELMSLFDPNRYPTAKDAERLYQDDPRLIRMFLHRFGKHPVINVRDDINVSAEFLDFELSEDEKEVYNKVRASNMGTEKYTTLRIAATDPRLVDPRTYRGSPSMKKKLEGLFEGDYEAFDRLEDASRFKALDSIVDEIMGRDEKVVIFSSFREGVTDVLKERYQKHGVCKIDGGVSSEPKGTFSPRDIERLEFQTNPDKKIMVSTINSLREGQDLHAAKTVIFLNQDISPGCNDQALGRVARIGQTGDVACYTLRAKGTIDFGVYAAELEKRQAIRMVDKGLELTPEQKELLKKGKVDNSFIKQCMENPEVLLKRMIGQMANRGAEKNKKYLDIGENAKNYADSYNFKWDTSYSGQTARLINGLIEELELPEEPKIIDLASGPATISRITGKRTTCVDINKYQLEIGKWECQKLGIEIEDIEGNVEDLKSIGIGDNSYDFAVLSLALHYGNWQRGDRKRMVLELNRVLRDGGYSILTIPDSYFGSGEEENLERGLESLGFDLIGGKHGVVRALDSVEKKYTIYAALCRKVSSNPNSYYETDQFNDLFRLSPLTTLSYPKEKTIQPPARGPLRDEICNLFQFEGGHIIGTVGIPEEPEEHEEPAPTGESPTVPEDAAPEDSVEEGHEVIVDYLRWLKENT